MIKMIDIIDLEPGMKLGEAIYNEENSIELLAKGTILTERHIQLLDNANIFEIEIEFSEDENFDLEKAKKEIEEIIEEDVEEVLVNVVNQNMKINILTGEGNIPIDERHEETIDDTKNVFEEIVSSDYIDIDRVEKNVHKMLPDMIRNDDVLMRLSQLKKSNDYTFEHSLRVSILASNIAKWLGYDKKRIEEVAQAGLLFDIGKLKIPSELLEKQEDYTEEEFEFIKKHAQLGYNVLLKTKGVSPAVKYAALQHHERMDGSGYPLRLRSGQIHEYAKIIMVCDVFDAMTSKKPYGHGLSKMEAADYLNWNTTIFDEKIVYILIKKISEFLLGKRALLSTNEVGKIVYIDVNYPTRPVIEVGDKMIDLVKEKDIKIMKIIES